MKEAWTSSDWQLLVCTGIQLIQYWWFEAWSAPKQDTPNPGVKKCAKMPPTTFLCLFSSTSSPHILCASIPELEITFQVFYQAINKVFLHISLHSLSHQGSFFSCNCFQIVSTENMKYPPLFSYPTFYFELDSQLMAAQQWKLSIIEDAITLGMLFSWAEIRGFLYKVKMGKICLFIVPVLTNTTATCGTRYVVLETCQSSRVCSDQINSACPLLFPSQENRMQFCGVWVLYMNAGWKILLLSPTEMEPEKSYAEMRLFSSLSDRWGSILPSNCSYVHLSLHGRCLYMYICMQRLSYTSVWVLRYIWESIKMCVSLWSPDVQEAAGVLAALVHYSVQCAGASSDKHLSEL